MGCGHDFTDEELAIIRGETLPAPPAPPETPPADDASWLKVEEIVTPPEPETPQVVALPAVREEPPVLKCPNCGAPPTEFMEGACFKCGAQAVFSLRDDFFILVSHEVAARSNIGGHGHDRNEDSCDCGTVTIGDDRTINWFVVCDGVSTSKNPQEASEVAVTTASALLKEAALANEPASAELLARAIDAAWHAVEKVKPELRAKPEYTNPATTMVLAYSVSGEDPWIGWCGDSPAYGIYRTDNGFVARKVVIEHTVLNDVLKEIDADKPEGEERPVETLAQQQSRGEKYLAEKYKRAFEAGDEAAMKKLLKDIYVEKLSDRYKAAAKANDETVTKQMMHDIGAHIAEGGAVEFVSMHTMVECLTLLPEGVSIEPSFARIPRENLVCLLGCSDGVGNDVHPMDSIDAPMLADMYVNSHGDALAFVDAAVAAASGTDNDTAAAIMFPPPAPPAPAAEEVPAPVEDKSEGTPEGEPAAKTAATTTSAPAPDAQAVVPAGDVAPDAAATID